MKKIYCDVCNKKIKKENMAKFYGDYGYDVNTFRKDINDLCEICVNRLNLVIDGEISILRYESLNKEKVVK